jgi:hypothetical protein
VLAWLRSQPSYQRRAKEVDLALGWMKDMGGQLGANMVARPKRKEPEELRKDGKWMDAPALLAQVEGMR